MVTPTDKSVKNNNPIKELLGSAKAKLTSKAKKGVIKPEPITEPTIVKAASPKVKVKKKKAKSGANASGSQGRASRANSSYGGTGGTVSRSTSEPTLAPSSGRSSVRGAASTLSVSSIRIGSSRSSHSGSRKGFLKRRKRPNSVQPLLANENPVKSLTRSQPSDPREPVFFLDVKTQNRRLVTPRQRQEIYALNRIMTRMENDRFRQFCTEKGFKGDALGENGPDISGYDMFL